jgi:hypothetical protein
MKVMITIISILIILAGLLPFLDNVIPLPIPTTEPTYQIIIIVLGIGGIVYAVLNNMLMGSERFVTVTIATLTLLGGVIPFLAKFLAIPSWIPIGGVLYPIMIVIIGSIGLIYGIIGMG